MATRRNDDNDILKDFLWDSQQIVNQSQAAREQAKQQHRATEVDSRKNLSDSNYKITEKIDQLTDSRKKLVEASVKIAKTVAKLQTAKQNNDAFFLDCQKQENILHGLNLIRNKNQLLNPSSDPLRKEINETLETFNSVQKAFHKFSFDCRLAISSLMSNQKEIELDLSSKRLAQMVDEDQLAKTKFSHSVTFKPTPARMPDGANDHVQWNRNLSDLLSDTYGKISSALQLIRNAESFVDNQSHDNAGRIQNLGRLLRQIYDRLNSAVRDYENQLKNVHLEMQKNEKDVDDLEQIVSGHNERVKLVETRLENRSFVRPLLAERTLDAADQALKLERQKLLDNGSSLHEKLSALKEARKLLSTSQTQLIKEIDNTKRLLETERTCINDLESATDKNLVESWRRIYNAPTVVKFSDSVDTLADGLDEKFALTD